MTVLARIKRAVLSGHFELTEKARNEMLFDCLSEQDLIEAIANATNVDKTIRSLSPDRSKRREYLYVIISPNLDGVWLYTKGKFIEERGEEKYYFFISTKHAE